MSAKNSSGCCQPHNVHFECVTSEHFVQWCDNVKIVCQEVWALHRMFEYLPYYGMQFALNSVGHVGMNIVMQQVDAFIKFNETFDNWLW